MSDYVVYAVGFLAQALFGARMIIQWIQSEKKGYVVSPTVFWKTSLVASALFLVYGILRYDVVIIFGQLLGYFIYVRNLQLKREWKKMPVYLRSFFLIFPVATLVWLFTFGSFMTARIFHPEVLSFIVVLGGIGQLLLNLRFVYQWYRSERLHESVLPLGFWIISVTGAVMVITYAVYRLDPVLLLAQTLGIVIYSRNIVLYIKSPADSMYDHS